MSKERIEILERALKREKEARKILEKILESKSRDLIGARFLYSLSKY